ncbi:MAG: methionyl-tRNA formyltransferase [Vicinamibacterales bacterium]
MVSSRPLRVAFFGTPDFAVPTLERLLSSRHAVVAAVTQPDRPRERGQRLLPTPAKVVAERHGVPVLQPERLKEEAFLRTFADLAVDCAVVAAYGKILPESLLSIPRLGFVNVHASLLPRWRGAAPVARAIMAGDTETGVTIMRVVRALDAGPMLAADRYSISDDETTADAEGALAELGADLLLEVLDRLEEGIPEVPQDEREATYAPRIEREEGLIDWTSSALAIHNQVRALQPWPRAWSFLDGKRLIILRTARPKRPARASVVDPSALPGEIVGVEGGILSVATGDGTIDILQVQPEGKSPMPARAFLAGHRLLPGAAFKSST